MALPEISGYQILRQIGSGGMATVYLAVQLSLERKVAIKVLRTTDDDDPERTEKRFLREGRTLAKLTHRNVCGIYDIAKLGDIAYIAMEYLDGGTLVDRLRSGVSVAESIAFIVQLASALEEAHKHGIIHRDLKPANVMLRGGRVPVLTDFGIARELTASQTRITAENMIVGTPIYMSPEQVSGGEVDGRSDLYALGVMFFELLTGRPPFQGDTPIAVCMQHLTAPIPRLPADLADLQPVIDGTLAKKREDRFDSMVHFTQALRDVFVGSEAMRRVLHFSPDTPWSEQLRELGFSFDTLRDAEVKSALEAQRRQARKAAPARSPTAVEGGRPAAPARGLAAGPPRWLWGVVAGVALLMLAGGGGWWWWSNRGPSERDLLALAALQGTFFQYVEQGLLFAPERGNALYVAEQMRSIDSRSPYTAQAFDKLRSEALRRAREALAERDVEALDALLAAGDRVLSRDQDWIDLARERELLRTSLASEAELAARLQRLGQVLDGGRAEPGETVLGLYLGLRQRLGPDARLEALAPRVLATVRGQVEAAVASGASSAALADARALAAAFPDDAELARRVIELESDSQRAELVRKAAAWELSLSGTRLDGRQLATLIEGLAELQRAGHSAEAQQAARRALAERVAQTASALAEASDWDAAIGLLGQARQGLGEIPALIELQRQLTGRREQALADGRAAAERARQGQLAIGASPWAQVHEVVGDGGQRIALPADASTPLLLTLPEGRYRVMLGDPRGSARRQESIEVRRGELASLRVRLDGYIGDDYLKDLGW